jgi:hypothetical protein
MSNQMLSHADDIGLLIRTIRGQKVILDTDLARIFRVPTFRFNEAIKRNRERFPDDFLFQLTREEQQALTSQIAMSKVGRGGRRTLPYAFTENGAIMAANVLNSPEAVRHGNPRPAATAARTAEAADWFSRRTGRQAGQQGKEKGVNSAPAWI